MALTGSLRSLNASINRIERESKKHQRSLARQAALLDKMEELQRAAFEVSKYENTIEIFRSIHKECGNLWDWQNINSTPSPIEPKYQNINEEIAQAKIDNYKPNFLEK